MLMKGMQLVEEVWVVSAHRLVQHVTEINTGTVHEAITWFAAEDEAEMQELCRLYTEGKTDERIIEQGPPNAVYEQTPRPRVETVAFYTPDGFNVLEDYRVLLGIPA